MPMFPILPALYFKFRYGTKIIFEVRDIWPLTILQMGSYKKAHPFVLLMRGIEKIAYRYSDYLVSVLDKAYLHFEASTSKKFRFQWISNGIDEEVLINQSDCEKLIPDKKFIVGYAGKMNVSNAVEFIVDAAIHLKDNQNIHFVFIGDGDEKAALIQRAQGLSNVTFIPKVKKHELHCLVKQFNVAIISFRKLDVYKYGVSTNKLFDYLMAGVPILMASSIEHQTYIESGAVIRVEAEDIKAISDSIIYLADSPQEDIKKLGFLGKDFATKNFTYKQLAKKYEQLFDSV
jgi:glycosyltransferase involved in cell wall biosynthesis